MVFKKGEIPKGAKPFIKGEERTKLIASKGGSTVSLQKSEAQKLHYIKQRMMKNGLTEKDIEWIDKMVKERPTMSYQIMATIEEMRKRPATLLKDISDQEIKAGKFIHGDKLETTNINVNLERQITDDERNIIFDLLKKRRE